MKGCLAAVLLVLTMLAARVDAHALQPGYLEMRVIGEDTYAVLWKVPVVGSGPMPITVRLPDSCETATPPEPNWDGTAFVSRWTTACPGGLGGRSLLIEGLEQTETDVLARVESEGGQVETHRFTPSRTRTVLAGRQDILQVVGTYFRLGVEHILGGIDHLLFVAALLLLVTGWKRLVGTITAFTLAHSLTLAASTLGVISVPVPPVEALIALSIAFVAAEAVHLRRGRRSLTGERPWIVAFLFGLLHGVGFASALSEIGLPQASVPAALLFFNLGVEAGQLLFVACLVLGHAVLRRLYGRASSRTAGAFGVLPAYAIGTMSMFWVAERIAGF